ncbi:octopamine receptor beta-2R-like [Lytechinus variegatus]|uniref:octopamine receptor beta-2R-like n=1 Tax=Lytechinus variegatus TaxID=7654 RepID=UPI001BB19006|nr:octopamine receptor beta-2R-like [Lytechinus variegatus]
METPPALDNFLMENGTKNGTQQVISIYEEYGYFNVIIVSTLFSVIAFVGLTGNTMVVIAVALSCKLQNITNAFIVNLSICDFITCVLLPFQAAAVISQDGWPLSDWVCYVIASLVIITPSTSILNLVMISLNRYILITKPRKLYMKVYTHHNVAWMIALTWLFPFFVLLMPQFFLGGLGYRPKFKFCLWNSEHEDAHIFQASGTLTFVVSTVLIIFSYASIFLFVRKHMHVMAKKESDDRASVKINERAHDNNEVKSYTSTKKETISKKQIEITKNLCVVVVTFFICTLPYSIHLPTKIYDMRGTYLGTLMVFNASINPILYAAKHPHFKIIFRCMFQCKYSDIPAPSRRLRKILNDM